MTLAKSGEDLGHHTMFLGMPAQPDGSTGLRNMRADAGIGGIPTPPIFSAQHTAHSTLTSQ